MIPRVIHQIWLKGGDLPSQLQENVDRLKERNRGWEHRVWSDDTATEFIKKHYGTEVSSALSRIDKRYGGPRSDFMRHMIIYALGGVYFDIKSGSDLPLDDVIRPEDQYLLAHWPAGDPCAFPHAELAHVPGGEFITWFLASVPGHPITSAMNERMIRNIARYRFWSPVGRSAALKVAGPIAYTLAAHECRTSFPHRIATFSELGLYYSPPGYDHLSVFPNHYSRQSAPLVKLSPAAAVLSRSFAALRSLKQNAA